MTQEERDALEAARLAAMLNRNPRRRGGGDVELFTAPVCMLYLAGYCDM